jgi:hypothetical protein
MENIKDKEDIIVLVYTKQDCSACEKYKIIIRKVCDDMCLELNIKDITNNIEEIKKLQFIGIKCFPVTSINQYMFEGCYSEKYIKNKIEEIINGKVCMWKESY